MKEWTCHNQCKSNCCSDFFLPLTDKQKEDFEKNGYVKVTNSYADFRWLKYHKSVTIEKSHVLRTIKFNKKDFEWKIIYNPILKTNMLWINDKCTKLLSNGKCGIYRMRPKACRVSKCPVYSGDKLLKWYADNGVLKDVRKKAEKEGKARS